MFEDGKIIPLHKALESVPRLYGYLTWGADAKGELTHLGLGMPDKDQRQWLAYVDVLSRVAAKEASRSSTATKTSAPNPTLLLKFREDIARSLEEKPESGEGE